MKDQKLSSACIQESHTNEPQNKQDKAAQDVTLGLGTKISWPSHDNVPNSNQQQHPSIVQWPYTPPNATEQLMAVSFPSQAPPPGFLNQWQQQLPLSQQSQVFAPQWFAGGSPFLGANICYPVGYTFPGFPGPCDPSSWLGQMHQLQHPYVYNFPGPPGFSSAAPAMSGCSTSKEHSLQRGIIRPTAKLSQKHKSLWDAQAKENAQLWSMVTKLQGEVSDYKDRLTKLEEEVSSLKQKVETPKTDVIGPIPTGTGQPPKRGRPPKRSLTSVNALHEPHPRAEDRKPALNQTQFESKSPIFEKVVLKKVDIKKGIANHHTATVRMPQQQINEKTLNAASNSMMSAYQGQVNREYQGIQMYGSGTPFGYASGAKVNAEKDKDLKIVNSEQSQPNKVLISSIGVSPKYIRNTGDGKFDWTSSNDPARNVLDAPRQSFFHNDSLLQQGKMITPGWNFANEEDELEDDAIGGSTKDENEEEMGENISFGAEDIRETKDT